MGADVDPGGARRGELRWLLAPALGVLAIFAVALGSLFQYSVRAFVPGSLVSGGFTLDNFSTEIGRAHV